MTGSLNEPNAGAVSELVPVVPHDGVATKFGFDIEGGTGGLNRRPAHIKAVIDASLKRLRTGRIDLLYQHRVDPNVPIEGVAGAAERADRSGQGAALRPF